MDVIEEVERNVQIILAVEDRIKHLESIMANLRTDEVVPQFQRDLDTCKAILEELRNESH